MKYRIVHNGEHDYRVQKKGIFGLWFQVDNFTYEQSAKDYLAKIKKEKVFKPQVIFETEF